MDDLVRSEEDCVDTLLDALKSVVSAEDALLVFSFASVSTLRAIEERFGLCRLASESTLRLRLALAAHRRAKAGDEKMIDTSKMTPGLLRRLSMETLAEWLPGYTDWIDEHDGQYHIRLLGGVGPEQDPAGAIFQVTTDDRRDPRRFIVAVGVIADGTGASTDSRQAVIQKAITDFPWDDFGLDDMPVDEHEWVKALASGIIARLNQAAVGVAA